MILFTRFKAVMAVAGAAILAAIPIMVEFKPDGVLAGLQNWLGLIWPVALLLVLYASTTLGYFLGKRDAPTSQLPKQEDETGGQSINHLIYAVRTATSALLDEGELRSGEVQNQLARLSRDHVAWHGAMHHNAREAFLGVARRAMEARELPTSWMAGPVVPYGDFPPGKRAEFEAEIKERSNTLIMALETSKIMKK